MKILNKSLNKIADIHCATHKYTISLFKFNMQNQKPKWKKKSSKMLQKLKEFMLPFFTSRFLMQIMLEFYLVKLVLHR